jgi:type IV pilus assembly protein PilA
MIQRIQKRLQNGRGDEGFTLIELMVVVLIIAILIAIAIPTFLGARKRAQDRAAQSSLRNTVTAAKAIFTDNEDYTAATQSALTDGEPAITFVASGAAAVDSTTVSSTATDVNNFYGASFSKSGKCWFVRDRAGPSGAAEAGTRWGVHDQATSAGCTGAAAAAWGGAWVKNPSDAVTA